MAALEAELAAARRRADEVIAEKAAWAAALDTAAKEADTLRRALEEQRQKLAYRNAAATAAEAVLADAVAALDELGAVRRSLELWKVELAAIPTPQSGKNPSVDGKEKVV